MPFLVTSVQELKIACKETSVQLVVIVFLLPVCLASTCLPSAYLSTFRLPVYLSTFSLPVYLSTFRLLSVYLLSIYLRLPVYLPPTFCPDSVYLSTVRLPSVYLSTFCLPSIYPDVTPHNKISQTFPHCIFILEALKCWR